MGKPPYHRDQKHTLNDNGMSNSLWDVTPYFNEPDGSSDYVAFGETSDASDDQDSYDIPRSPPGITSYIHAWFSTDFSDIYGELWEEYKQYPDDYKAWDLSVQWVPSDYSSSTLVTVSHVDKSIVFKSLPLGFLNIDSSVFLYKPYHIFLRVNIQCC